MPRKVSPEPRDIPRHGSGDPLLNRSGLMSWSDGFGHEDSRNSPGKAGNSWETSKNIQMHQGPMKIQDSRENEPDT